MGIYKATIAKWVLAKESLDSAKKTELDLRLKICDAILQGQDKEPVTEVVGGYSCKASPKINTSIDADALEEDWDSLLEEEQACFKYKPSLVKKELDKQEPDSDVFRYLSEKPGTPTLKVEKLETE